MALIRPTAKPSDAEIRAIIYRRISLDRTGEEAGVTRQATDCTAYCAHKNWTVVANLEDNDLSASRYARKKRPAYQEALRMIEAGEADALVAYNLDRLWRQPKELEHLIDLVEDRGLIVATLTGDINLMSGEGRLHARILVTVAASESDNISRRTKRVKDQLALDGLPASGAWTFGWNRAVMVGAEGERRVREGPRAGMIPVPEEAAAIRDAARRFLAGESLSSIARRWNTAGLSTRKGPGLWDCSRVRVVLANPRNAGLRYHRGEFVARAAWPPIISETTWRRIATKLADPARRQLAPKRASLLTGLLKCGKCGNGLIRNWNGRHLAIYACRRLPGRAGCNGIAVSAQPLEELLTEALLVRFDAPALERATKRRAAKPTDDMNLSASAVLEARLTELAEIYADGDIGRGEWLTARERIESRLDVVRKRQAATNHAVALDPYHGQPGLLRLRWPEMTFAEQRSILAAAIDRVTIKPATRRGPSLDPNRIDIAWRR